MTKIPVSGAIWGTMQYLAGFQRLGHDVYYVEAHGRTPTMLMTDSNEDYSTKAAAFISGIMRRFGMDDRWAFHAVHDHNRHFGMSAQQLARVYETADLLINYHGGTPPLEEHVATGRLVYLETDPVQIQIRLHDRDPRAEALLKSHQLFFTWGENYGHPDCGVPLDPRFPFQPTRPPIVPDWWPDRMAEDGAFTTIGNWRQAGSARLNGSVYHWSKDLEFLKFIDLPARSRQSFELALGSYEPSDLELLEQHGWKVRPAESLSWDLELYREYIANSRAEFTVAKDQNVRLRSGWFSERSAQYLAAGKPVITQETGFSNILPTGDGLFPFTTMEDILSAITEIQADYSRHSRAAKEIAREYFDYRVVLPQLLDRCGL